MKAWKETARVQGSIFICLLAAERLVRSEVFTLESIAESDVTFDIKVNCGQTEAPDRFSAANNLVKVLCFKKNPKNVS